MPVHITLLVPFADTDFLVAELIRDVRNVLSTFAPFDFVLMRPQRFDGGDAHVLWLEPSPAGPFAEMIAALVAAFPNYPPYGAEFDEITPHLTVAVGDSELLDEIEADVAAALPIQARATHAQLYVDGPDGWREHVTFDLQTA